MKISSKPAVYIIDGLNFVRSFLLGFGADEDAVTAEFLDWLERASMEDKFAGSDFRVIFDGPHRNIGSTRRGSIHIIFAEDRTADDMIIEQSVYLHNSEQRVIVITSDRSIHDEVRPHGVKCIFCDGFFKAVKQMMYRDK
ncbi:hypothetical protein Dip518_001115 [Parelusimicrobium proximum]|uniref:NYN domain-containing protein n=1 Tax=Parelusimicrobium proximum TaxID=3228953 RepID=UPI003D16A9C3